MERLTPDQSLIESAPHLLLVDDDRRIRQLLARYLASEGFLITNAANAAEAREHLDNFIFDLLILDVMMPGENGLEFAQSLRNRQDQLRDIPVLMLTARSESSWRVSGLEAGVDDYLTKPFEPRELSLRIGSILRRVNAARPTVQRLLKFGDFTFEIERGELRQNDIGIRLSERERDMLQMLLKAPGATVSREAMAGDTPANERTIDVQVNRLRRKIETDPANPRYLQTVRGSGYRFLLDP